MFLCGDGAGRVCCWPSSQAPIRTGRPGLEASRLGVHQISRMCSVFWPMCSLRPPNVFSFWPDVFTFPPDVFSLAGDVFSEEVKRGERRGVRVGGGSALGMRAWTGWRVALGLIMVLGPGRRRRDGEGDAGMTGRCQLDRVNVSTLRPDVSTFRPNVSSFGVNVSTLRAEVSTLAGKVASLGRRALDGDGARTEGEIRSFCKLRAGSRLRRGELGTTPKWDAWRRDGRSHEGPGVGWEEVSRPTGGGYNQPATKADLANLETRLTTWFAGLVLLVVINVLGTVTGILIALLGVVSKYGGDDAAGGDGGQIWRAGVKGPPSFSGAL